MRNAMLWSTSYVDRLAAELTSSRHSDIPPWMDAYETCALCPRLCRVHRLQGQKGVCRSTSDVTVASFTAHHGEEPPISGTRGSGTVFFSGCPVQCFFCQNHQISRQEIGTTYSYEDFYHHVTHLMADGVHNINWVTPQHYWPHIRHVVSELKSQGYHTPFVFNTSGYHLPELMREYVEYIDIFLQDFKCMDPSLAKEITGDADYAHFAMAALRIAVEKRGFLRPWDESGQQTAKEGVLVRHLVLPGHADDSCRILHSLYNAFGPSLPLSIMSQYMPTAYCSSHPSNWQRKTSIREYDRVCDCVEKLGFTHVFIQQDGGEEGYMPDFSQEQPFRAQTP
ncbi:MAG: radical SAM protein [Spartobacteria bacterium]|nr:radical SAM protein [Spartobacteria bacterium]